MAKTFATPGISSALRLIGMLLLSVGGLLCVGPVAAEPPPAAGADSGMENRGLLADPPEGVKIQIWWGLGGPLREAFEKQVARFNESQKKIVVEVRSLPGYEGGRQPVRIPAGPVFVDVRVPAELEDGNPALKMGIVGLKVGIPNLKVGMSKPSFSRDFFEGGKKT